MIALEHMYILKIDVQIKLCIVKFFLYLNTCCSNRKDFKDIYIFFFQNFQMLDNLVEKNLFFLKRHINVRIYKIVTA